MAPPNRTFFSNDELPELLALGSDLKNTVAFSQKHNLFLSPPLGNLETPTSLELFEKTIEQFKALPDFCPSAVVCDLHPSFYSSRYAETLNLPIQHIQHHHAHMASCIYEHGLQGEVLGVIWDGTGFGPDRTIWGGEFLVGHFSAFKRVAYVRPFSLVGGDQAVREPRRSTLGILYEIFGTQLPMSSPSLKSFLPQELEILSQALTKNVGTVRTSSMGRLFDAVASMANLYQKNCSEAQAAIALESYTHLPIKNPYPHPVTEKNDHLILEWEPMIHEILKEKDITTLSSRFHATLVAWILDIARHVGIEQVVLSGGVFQNQILLKASLTALQKNGFKVFYPQKIPPHDEGISIGQIFIAAQGTLCA